MSPAELLPPTAEEARALASLALHPHLASYQTILSLQGVLDFLSQTDVFDFLFTEQPVHVRHIAMTNVLSKSIAGHFTKTRIEPGNCSNDSLSHHASGSYLLMPAFTVNHTTYGFGTHTYFHTFCQTASRPRPPAFYTAESKFVKNEASGILLNVIDSEQSGIVTVEYSHMAAFTRLSRSSATFNRNKFRSVIKSGALDMPRVLSCISEFYTADQYRRCPLCACVYKVCACVPRPAHPRHPFDTTAFLQNMSLRFGKFEGVAGVTCYEDGKHSRKALLGCRYAIDGHLNISKVEQMRSMAIDKLMGRSSPRDIFVAPEMPASKPSPPPYADEQPGGDILFELLSKQNERRMAMRAGCDGDPARLPAPAHPAAASGLPFDDQDSTLPDDFGLLLPEGAHFLQPSCAEHPQHQSATACFGKLPAHASPPATPLSSSTQHSKEEELVRLQKVEKRKARNRASAMRSHLKKKAFIDGLKQELYRNHDNILHLRSREMMLRKENLRLRKLLT